MSTEHIETVIIGAGQAGLSTAYHLKKQGRACVVLDSNARIGDNWRRHWDTLRLYSPAKYDGLPGMPFPADPWTFPQKDEVAAFLESYALKFDLPVRMSTRVDALEQRADGGFELLIGDHTITCDNVVVATGTFGQAPNLPDFAQQLDPSIRQLHSSEYHRPDDLQPGPVLVVGASHSGTDIAYEAAQTNPVTLCGRDPGQLPFKPEQRQARFIFPVVIFAWRHVLTRRTPMGRKEFHEVRAHGGPMIRVHREDLAARGVERHTARMVGVRGRHAAARGRHRRAGHQRRLGHRLPAGLRLDQAPGGRRGRLARGDARRGRPGARALLLRPGVPVRVQLDGLPGHRPGRGVPGAPDRRPGEGQGRQHQAA